MCINIFRNGYKKPDNNKTPFSIRDWTYRLLVGERVGSMSHEGAKYGHRTINWFEGIVNKLGGEEKAEKFLRGELVITELNRSWYKKDGFVQFSVTSNGRTGEEWIIYLERKGVCLNKHVKELLISPDIAWTRGSVTEVVVTSRDVVSPPKNNGRVHVQIGYLNNWARERHLVPLSVEAFLLILDKFTFKEIEAMGLKSIIGVHEIVPGNSIKEDHMYDASRDFLAIHTGDYSLGPSLAIRSTRETGFAFGLPASS